MFEYGYFYDFIKTKDGEETKPNLHAINFRRLQSYNKDWKLNQIIFYEYLLQCHRRYGKVFTRSRSDFKNDTLISEGTVRNLVEDFEKRNFIKVTRSEKQIKGQDFRNRYSVDFEVIKQSLRDIYDFGNKTEKEIQENEEILKAWYDYLSNNTYKESNNIDSSEEFDPENNSLTKDSE